MFTDSIPSDEFTVCLLYYLFKVALISLAHAHGYARTPQLQTREKAGLSECSKRTPLWHNVSGGFCTDNVICSFTRSYVRRDVISGNEVPPFKNNKTDELGGLNGLRGFQDIALWEVSYTLKQQSVLCHHKHRVTTRAKAFLHCFCIWHQAEHQETPRPLDGSGLLLPSLKETQMSHWMLSGK